MLLLESCTGGRQYCCSFREQIENNIDWRLLFFLWTGGRQYYCSFCEQIEEKIRNGDRKLCRIFYKKITTCEESRSDNKTMKDQGMTNYEESRDNNNFLCSGCNAK